ncbi:MAG: hypothetical protein JNK47_16115 [Mesorhizobium sp.]|nr:hypothetical protein [Mesorhizobium sp.]MBL8578749.1 hypothetical protein [Mesorhizobium sp.]
MPLTELVMSQITDLFRIGLLVALVVTAYNTAANVGLAVPLALGAVFVAVLIPVTMQAPEGVTLTMAILTGLAVNVVIIAIILAARTVLMRALASANK